jgi:membrane protease YdiL (CAAX protease family)
MSEPGLNGSLSAMADRMTHSQDSVALTEKPNPNKLKALLRAGLFWVCFFAWLFLVRVIVGMLGFGHSASDARGQWCGGILITVFMLIVTWIFVRTEKAPLIVPGTAVVAGSVPRTFAGMLCILPLAALSVISLHWLVPGVEFTLVTTSVPHVLSTLALYIVLAAYEEIAFRGYPMRRLLCAFSVWPTLLLIALIFVIYHVVLGWGLIQAIVGTGAGSMLFGTAAIASKHGLAFPIGVHAGWNFVTWSLGTGGMGIWKMSFPESLSGRVQLVGMCAYLACVLLGTLLFWFWGERDKRIGPHKHAYVD